VAWLETGGILCSVNIRGGNEFGAKWHEAGTLTKKQNVFDDFIAASEFLIAEKYTSKELLAINGASNGGLLVGACMTQRPDLYAVCLPQVGVLDMLRFEQSSVGTHWTADYGSVKTQEGFENLLKYSPFHNIKSTTYPATLILTGQQDDRVAPWHSYKFAATLQEKQEGNNPIHLCATPDAGHGTGKSLKKQVDEASMMLAFSLTNMGLDYSLQ
ncbi:MAG: S9 family peptidase, partial [Saprospiraceae bacterium]|nr:S9 family peptidase [Saprospiraceae bacterium]